MILPVFCVSAFKWTVFCSKGLASIRIKLTSPKTAEKLYSPATLRLTEKEAEIVRDGVESGSIADGLADSESSTLSYAEWQAVDTKVGAKLSIAIAILIESGDEATIIERAFSDSTLFEAYDRDKPARKAGLMRVAVSLQRKLAASFERQISMPAELG
jgi:hypothetical protein